jgi:hypothetical protein
MQAMSSSNPPARQNGWIAKSLNYQCSGGFFWIGRIFPTVLHMRARAHTRT